MSKPQVYYWPAVTGNEQAIALSQDVAVNTNVAMIANVPDVYNVYQYDKMVRTIKFYNTDNLINVGSFVVKGFGLVNDVGVPKLQNIEEVIVAPSALASVTSQYYYSRIDSITATIDDITGTSIGFGSQGITDYYFFDTNRSAWYASAQLQFFNPTGIQVTVAQTLNKPYIPKFDGSLVDFEPIPGFTLPDFDQVSVNTIGNFSFPVAMTWAFVTGTTADSFYFTVLQQGTV